MILYLKTLQQIKSLDEQQGTNLSLKLEGRGTLTYFPLDDKYYTLYIYSLLTTENFRMALFSS